MSQTASSLRTTEMLGFVDRWRAGDRAAANALIRRTEERLKRIAVRMYRGFPNVRSVAEPGDVIQASWMRLLKTLENLRPESMRDFFNLAAVHVRRELLDLARRAKTVQYRCVSLNAPRPGADSSSGLPVPEPADRTPDDLDLWARFHEAVEELDAAHREVVSLIFYHGRTQREIAAWFGKDERTIRRWWAAALLELRTRVGGSLPGRSPEE
ncbi:sigma-70 family RNA polymerase sigma factor [bacterium]|nr:sigma-70 family RNA polymerase sigma factor [bacterium]